MRVGLITYNRGHRKTMEIALKLLTRGHQVCLFAFPFNERSQKPSPPFADRPFQLCAHDPQEFAKAYGMSFYAVPGWDTPHDVEFFDYPFSYEGPTDAAEVFLNCIAKIIPQSFIEGRTILNCHPGLLPDNRGVDAFKWALVNGWPLGVTLHKIDERIDGGVILHRQRVPVLSTDTLDDICARMYAVECDLLANFDTHLHSIKANWRVADVYPISHRRIPPSIDYHLPLVFAENRSALMRAA